MKAIEAKATHVFLGRLYQPGTCKLIVKIDQGPKATIGKSVEVTVTKEQALEMFKKCTGTTKEDVRAAINNLENFLAKW